jgi:hypothetical protein
LQNVEDIKSLLLNELRACFDWWCNKYIKTWEYDITWFS